jgi:hypothetical protein
MQVAWDVAVGLKNKHEVLANVANPLPLPHHHQDRRVAAANRSNKQYQQKL